MAGTDGIGGIGAISSASSLAGAAPAAAETNRDSSAAPPRTWSPADSVTVATRPGDSAASVRARAFAAMAREAGLAPAARAEFVRRATTLDEGALNAPADSAAGQARARSAADASAAIQRGEIQVAPTRAQAGLLNLMKARDQQSVAGLPPAGAAVALPQAANVVPGTAGTSAVTPEVASAILANVASGRPPFNPELGQVGRVSWFVTAGDPYTST